MKKNTLILVVVISIAMGYGIWREKATPTSQFSQKAANEQIMQLQNLVSGAYIPNGVNLPEFTLKTVKNTEFHLKDFNDHWSFVFFGYTSCPKVCPMTLATMKQLADRVGKTGNTQYVFISIDPKHDTPEVLAKYFHSPQFKGANFQPLTGSQENVVSLAKSMGAFISDSEDPETGHFEHSGAIMLVNPKAQMTAIFTDTTKVGAIAQDYKKILHYYSRSNKAASAHKKSA